MSKGFIPGIHEAVDHVSQLSGRANAGPAQTLARQDREPDFHLVEPGGSCRGIMEVDIGMTFEPAIIFGLMGTEVVEHNMDLPSVAA